ncbi:ADP-ribosylglycohydrolase family protein [Solibacillus cecembensis]|uniref:ADP-ribosylglycohydrolase family protein n=1 Tax=Solibacillus cecembensis TaxID=459347 RepID=UPI00071721F9
MNKRKRALWGFIIGDAYGVPMEFMERDSFEIHDMIGYGCWDVPAGTWSDDSAMTLITIQHLIEDTSIADLKRAFCNWVYRGHWSYNDEPAFDVGMTIAEVISRWETKGLFEAAKDDDQCNGNGALMRILPIALYSYGRAIEDRYVKDYATLTHGHIRSTLCCFHYTYMVHALMDDLSLEASLARANEQLLIKLNEYPEEMVHFERILNIAALSREDIQSNGYVIHTLEAVYWSLLNSESYYDAIFKAVHLGNDTDTIAAITGGLAGIYYEELNIPNDWMALIPKQEEIDHLINRFVKVIF